MAKRVAAVNDLSGFGKCSLSASMAVMSVLGVQACPLPTSVLSNQTCFESFYMEDLTDFMEKAIDKWKELNFDIDGIYSGFLSDEIQIDAVLKLCKIYKNAVFILDPVLGDDGVPYANFNEGLLLKMNMLLKRAHIITPNVTELCLLSKEEYTKDREKIESMAFSLFKANKNLKAAVITGIENGENIENLVFENGKLSIVEKIKKGGGYSGTGDIMAAIISAYAVEEKSILDGVKKAADFISICIEDTLKTGQRPEHGIEFEKNLAFLLK